MQVEISTEVNCSRAHLWSFFEDVEKLKLWVPGFQELVITSPEPHGEGSTYLLKVKEGRRVVEYQGVNLIWDPPRRIKEHQWGGRLKESLLMTTEYRLTDLGGRTRFEYKNDFKARSFLMELLMPLVFILGRAYGRSMIKALKEQAEKT